MTSEISKSSCDSYYYSNTYNAQKPDLKCYETLEEPEEKPQYIINQLTISEFLSSLQTEYQTDRPQRLNNLLNMFSFIAPSNAEEREHHILSIQIPKGFYAAEQEEASLNLIVLQNDYDTQCFQEQHLLLPGQTPHQKYTYINLTYEDEDKLYFQIRLDAALNYAEILHIEKCHQISGSHIKNLCMSVLRHLNPYYIYLSDDAEYETKSGVKLPLRVLLPIVAPEPKTWYSPDGFGVYECDGLISYSDPTLNFKQSIEEYQLAVESVRTQSLNALTSNTKVDRWKRRYLNQNIDEEISVHRLAQPMFQSSRDSTNPNKQNQASSDLEDFYHLILSPQVHHPKTYSDSLIKLYNFVLWIKNNT